ncbi:MAG: LLM class flavin-dependent oxidoreductase [Dehalococcoidia bacterium]|nr:LLM class flavin-dependent oxidoreductase [Dehalococcoidia bacterium]
MARAPIGVMMGGPTLRHGIEIAKKADAAGFHSVWSGDGGDPFSSLTTYALNTTEVRVGTGVAVWHRPPVIAANAALQLAANSDGRFLFGLGAGPKQWNEDWWGIPFDAPIGRMKEYIEVIRGVFHSGPDAPFSYEGKRFQVRNYRRSSRHTPPPILIGTVGEQMNRLAGRIADGVIHDVLLPPAYLREVAIPAVEAGLRAAGRARADFLMTAMVACIVDPDETVAKRAMKFGLQGHLQAEYFYPVWGRGGFEPEARRAQHKLLIERDPVGAADAISDDLAAAVGIVGTPDQCRRQLAAMLEYLDVVILWSPHARGDSGASSELSDLIDLFAETTVRR